MKQNQRLFFGRKVSTDKRQSGFNGVCLHRTIWHPGNDLIAKRILADPKVMNIITQSLTGTSNNYFIGNCEWSNGTRSDMVLEPKSPHSGLPPLIVEVQHTVNLGFMKRAVSYCLQAYMRYDNEPTILIFCVEQLQHDILKHVKPSKLPGVFTYFSQPWQKTATLFRKKAWKTICQPL